MTLRQASQAVVGSASLFPFHPLPPRPRSEVRDKLRPGSSLRILNPESQDWTPASAGVTDFAEDDNKYDFVPRRPSGGGRERQNLPGGRFCLQLLNNF